MKPKTDTEIAAMRKSGHILGTVLEHIRSIATEGMTPKQVSAIARQKTLELGGEPAFEGFEGYPDIICISTNNEVQHSIPNNRPFELGDIVNFDYGVRYEGMITDSGTTVCIGGKPDKAGLRLLKGTEQALYAGIDVVKAGARVGDIS